MLRILLFICVLILPSLAHASVLEDKVSHCQTIENDEGRLACFDSLKPQAVETGLKESSGVGKWNVSSETNPIDDSKTVFARLTADEGISRWKKPVSLLVRCKSDKTEFYITWHDYLGRDAYVLTRVGSDKPQTKKWSLSSDSKATFHPSGTIAFLKQMEKNDKFLAQVTPYNESPLTAIFDTTGMSEALKPIKETCHWE